MPAHSLMAERVAIGRAAHQFIDPPPVIFTDPLARRLIGADGERWVEKNLQWLKLEGMRRTRVLLALRSRLAEEELERAIASGTRQYVILGAGLETFAYRRPDLAATLTVYEVDEPGTQQWKRARLAAAGIEPPGNVRFVPLDLTGPTLAEGLAAAGFRRDAGAFFSCLGVIYYLPPASAMELLAFVGGQRGARQIVFDYAIDAAALPEKYREIWKRVSGYTAATGEPWQTWFAPDVLAADLRAMGFTATEHIEANALLERYTGVTDDDLTPMMALMSARGA
jgi:methyltransferase (TIGR00027 family)